MPMWPNRQSVYEELMLGPFDWYTVVALAIAAIVVVIVPLVSRLLTKTLTQLGHALTLNSSDV